MEKPKLLFLKTCENCNNYGVGMYQHPCNDCDPEGIMYWWTQIEHNRNE